MIFPAAILKAARPVSSLRRRGCVGSGAGVLFVIAFTISRNCRFNVSVNAGRGLRSCLSPGRCRLVTVNKRLTRLLTGKCLVEDPAVTIRPPSPGNVGSDHATCILYIGSAQESDEGRILSGFPKVA